MKPTAVYCSQACIDAAKYARRRNGGKEPVVALSVTAKPEPAVEEETIEARTRVVLEAASRLASPLGAAAIRMAHILDTSMTMNGYASLVKQWNETLETALAGAVVEPDKVDELRAFRDRKFAG